MDLPLAASEGSAQQGGLILALVAAAAVGIFWLSLRSHPYKSCRRCKGLGRYRHPFFPWAYRICSHCTGGRVLRAGAPGRKK